jgi:predicted DNA-binding transcriptional regulator AlpA
MSSTDDERLSRATVLKMLGGDKAVHVSTLYRLMDADRFPRPVKLSSSHARWLRSEVDAALRKMVAERGPGVTFVEMIRVPGPHRDMPSATDSTRSA